MKALLACTMVGAFLADRAASAADIHFERACAGQIAALVQTAHQAPGKAFKKIVFSKATDRSFITLFEDLKELNARVIPGAPPDQFLREKIDANFTKTVELARRTAARPMQTCVASLDALGAAVPTVCPDYAKDAADPAKANACHEKASQTPAAKAASDAWTAAMSKLISK